MVRLFGGVVREVGRLLWEDVDYTVLGVGNCRLYTYIRNARSLLVSTLLQSVPVLGLDLVRVCSRRQYSAVFGLEDDSSLRPPNATSFVLRRVSHEAPKQS